MALDSPIKQLLMGDLSVLKKDDPALIDEFVAHFQTLTGKQTMAADMMFIRACHFNSVNVANALIEKKLISGIDMYEQTSLRGAIINDSEALITCLKNHGATISTPDYKWLNEAAIQGAVACLPTIVKAMQESGIKPQELSKLLDKCAAHLVRNERKKDAQTLVNGLRKLNELGANTHGCSQNLLANAVLAHRYSDMSEVVDFIISNGVTESAIKAARSALSSLVSDIRASNFETPNLARFDPVTHFKSMKEKIENAARAQEPSRGSQPLACLS